MERFFRSGQAVDLILAVIAVEFLALTWLRRGGSLLARVLALGPGVMILLALRGALTGASWPWIALPLAASFPIHLTDVIRRKL